MLPCSAADFAEDLRMMNAKARKKEKRRAKREALKTTTATEDAAPDATLLFEDESTTATPTAEDSPMDDDDEDAAAAHFVEMLPQIFALAVTTRLLEAGHREPTEMELITLARIMEDSILPTIEPYVLAMRSQEDEGKVIERVSLQYSCKIYTDKTQDEATTRTKEGDMAAQGAPQQEPAGALQGSQTDPVRAQQDTGEGATDAAQSTLWEAALDTAKSEGGSAEEVKARAVKILRKRKQRLKEKSKVKKQAVIAA